MVLQTMPVNEAYSISVGFENGTFGIETVYHGRGLGASQTRCDDIVEAGRCVAARVERLGRGVLTRSERDQIVSMLTCEKQKIENKINQFLSMRQEDGTIIDEAVSRA